MKTIVRAIKTINVAAQRSFFHGKCFLENVTSLLYTSTGSRGSVSTESNTLKYFAISWNFVTTNTRCLVSFISNHACMKGRQKQETGPAKSCYATGSEKCTLQDSWGGASQPQRTELVWKSYYRGEKHLFSSRAFPAERHLLILYSALLDTNLWIARINIRDVFCFDMLWKSAYVIVHTDCKLWN